MDALAARGLLHLRSIDDTATTSPGCSQYCTSQIYRNLDSRWSFARARGEAQIYNTASPLLLSRTFSLISLQSQSHEIFDSALHPQCTERLRNKEMALILLSFIAPPSQLITSAYIATSICWRGYYLTHTLWHCSSIGSDERILERRIYGVREARQPDLHSFPLTSWAELVQPRQRR